MFFDRLGSSSEPTPSSLENSKRRKKLAMLSLAAAMALPAGALGLSALYAEETGPKDAAPSPADDAMRAARQQMDQGNYDQAVRTLRQVNSATLSDSERRPRYRGDDAGGEG